VCNMLQEFHHLKAIIVMEKTKSTFSLKFFRDYKKNRNFQNFQKNEASVTSKMEFIEKQVVHIFLVKHS
jgi:hypothetical protein